MKIGGSFKCDCVYHEKLGIGLSPHIPTKHRTCEIEFSQLHYKSSTVQFQRKHLRYPTASFIGATSDRDGGLPDNHRILLPPKNECCSKSREN